MAPRPLIVRSVPIELAQLIKYAGLTESGGNAKQAISEGKVQVNGAVETRKGRKLGEGDVVSYADQAIVVALQMKR